jgi:allantoinase
MSTKAIYSKRCWINNAFTEATIYFDEKIENITLGKQHGFENIVNAADAIVMPGIIDIHVHVNEPGRTDWEGFDTATKAAATGGITTIIDMPLNANPVTTSLQAFNEKLSASKNKLHVNVGFYGGVVPGNANNIEELIQAGVCGFKAFLTHSGIDEFPNVTEADLEIVMPILAKHNIPLLVHCELSDNTHENELTSNPTSYTAYLKSRPKEWEDKAVMLMIDLCRKHKCAVHIVHVSSSTALHLIQKAKQEGLKISAETCPQYLLFVAESIPDGATIYKCAPPIREKENNQQLKDALKTGVLDLIATDHSPAPPSLKEITSGNFQKAWGGIAGLQFLLPSSYTALKQELSLKTFIPLLTEYPAKFLNVHQQKGFLRDGYDADITIWQPEENFVVKEEDILHKHKISPYVSKALFGKIQQTYVNGKLVFDHTSDNGEIIQKNCGKWLLKK